MKKSCLVSLSATILSFCAGVTHGDGSVPAFPDSLPTMWSAFEADYTGNVAAPFTVSFTSAQVDPVQDKLTLSNLGFERSTGVVTIPRGTQIYFSTTGTLPEPLVAGRPYLLAANPTGGYDIYPLADDSFRALLDGMTEDDDILYAQNLHQNANKINLTSGGSGTHTITTNTLVSVFNDRLPTGFNFTPASATDLNQGIERKTDGEGQEYLYTRRMLREPTHGLYNAYGKGHRMGPLDKRLAIRQKSAEKRVLWQLHVMDLKDHSTRGNPKCVAAAAGINTVANQISSNTHYFATGDKVKAKPYSGATLPSGLVAGTVYYCRRLSSTSFSLHTTAAGSQDGSGTLDIVPLGTTGSGSFVFYAPARVADANRWGFVNELMEPSGDGGDGLVVGTNHVGKTNRGIFVIDALRFKVSGEDAGTIYTYGTTFDDLDQIEIWLPSEAVGPTRADTGTPLSSGTYWISKPSPSASAIRLHTSLASAQGSVGLGASASTCIKFNAMGSGELQATLSGGRSYTYIGIPIGSQLTHSLKIPFGKHAHLFVADFNDPAESTPVLRYYVDGVFQEQIVLGGAKGDTAFAKDNGGGAGTLFNSDARHVTLNADYYAGYYGASTGAVGLAALDPLHDYIFGKYFGAAGTLPAITSPTSFTGMAGSALSYQIAATNGPTSYGASGLPSGVSVNASTGLISGTATAGTYAVTLAATNSAGTGTATLTLTINPAVAPVITSPTSFTGMAGSALSFQIAATNSPTSYGASGLPSGLSLNVSTGFITGTVAAAGTYAVTLEATNSAGTGMAALTLAINPAPVGAVLIHKYTFDGDFVDSAGESDGTLVGGATISNGALQLPGYANSTSSYGALPAAALSGLSSATFEAWFTVNTDTFFNPVFFAGTSDGNNALQFVPNGGGSPSISQSDFRANGGTQRTVLGLHLNAGTKYYVAVVYDAAANQQLLYLGSGGTIQKTGTGTMNAQNLSQVSLQKFYLGAWRTTSYSLNGSIDEFRVYNGVLTPAQVGISCSSGPGSLMVFDSYQAFQASAFPAGSLLVAPNDDFDADGICNLLEYAFGLDPVDPDAVPPSRMVQDGNSLFFEYEISPWPTDLSFGEMVSADLASGIWHEAIAEVDYSAEGSTIQTIPDGRLQFRLNVIGDGGARFWRLEVSQQ